MPVLRMARHAPCPVLRMVGYRNRGYPAVLLLSEAQLAQVVAGGSRRPPVRCNFLDPICSAFAESDCSLIKRFSNRNRVFARYSTYRSADEPVLAPHELHVHLSISARLLADGTIRRRCG